jgi:hypothetical protein
MDWNNINRFVFIREVVIFLGFGSVPYIYLQLHPAIIFQPHTSGYELAKNFFFCGYPTYLLIRSTIWGVRWLKEKK